MTFLIIVTLNNLLNLFYFYIESTIFLLLYIFLPGISWAVFCSLNFNRFPRNILLLYKYINKNMKVEIRNIDTRQYLRTISSEELLSMCGNDKRMFDDYVRLLRKHPRRKSISEIWEIID